MRTYEQLNAAEKKQAQEVALTELLTAVCEGALRFDDAANKDDLQARIEAAGKRADAMQTPWFFHEYLMDDAVIKETFEGMAAADAEGAIYPDAGDRIIRLPRGSK